ncbi:MAG: YitT family protein [Desulfovibrionaceae bacterium]|jgi:uncharacterized membrane-anchored protein YitT (DUF2179 family)|nr:YitT family protein [Desulfovibrionaceae bacterium]
MLIGLKQGEYTRSVPWNVGLLTLGALVYAFGINTIAVPHGFIAGGVYGLGLLGYYATNLGSPALWYLALNIPVFVLGAVLVSRRFFLYSLYGMLALTFLSWAVPPLGAVHDPILASVAGGVLCGAGTGLMLRSLGSGGGLDIVAVILHERFAVRIGQFGFLFNLLLFAGSLLRLDTDRVLYSMIMSFIISVVADHFLSMFNQRKMVLVISDKNDDIAAGVLKDLHRGATFLHGRGAYSGNRKKVLLCVVNNYQLKKLEGLVYSIDPNAFMVVENTFNVLGIGFSRRKVY